MADISAASLGSSEAPTEVLVNRDGCVGIVSLNRPARMNAVHPEMGAMLTQAFVALEADPSVRAIVLAGEGKAFCAGADISGETGNAEVVLRDMWNPLIETMLGLEVPIVAALNGVAAGAGASLAFACDLRVASTSARFQLSFVKIGLMPDAGASWLLPRIVGLGRANEMALLGEDIGAADAHTWGLVNRLVDDGDALSASVRLAARFGEVAASAGTIKRMHRQGLDNSLADHLADEAVTQGRLQNTPDFAEATAAFREKRTPNFAPRESASAL